MRQCMQCVQYVNWNEIAYECIRSVLPSEVRLSHMGHRLMWDSGKARAGVTTELLYNPLHFQGLRVGTKSYYGRLPSSRFGGNCLVL